jgi:REP element-mobilizing transposase RayT
MFMHFEEGNLYHIYNQGNNKREVFFDEKEYFLFLWLIRKNLLPYSELLAYCLMPNHFHLMIYADQRCSSKIKQGGLSIDPITNSFRKILSSYTRVKNEKTGNSGSVFRQKTKAKSLSDMEVLQGDMHSISDYYQNCFYYIHQNPLRAGLVSDLVDWQYSSYLDYAGLRGGSLCNKLLAEKFGLYNPKTFTKQCLNY